MAKSSTCTYVACVVCTHATYVACEDESYDTYFIYISIRCRWDSSYGLVGQPVLQLRHVTYPPILAPACGAQVRAASPLCFSSSVRTQKPRILVNQGIN